MTDTNITIRSAAIDDARQLLDIYRPYVEKTAISFEYDAPSLSEFRQRIEKITQSYPYIVAERNGEILGYAYVSRFHERKAYDFSVETSIYIKRDMRRSGIGRMLYTELEERLARQGIVSMYAGITYTDRDDEYVNSDSVEFHKRMGFSYVGEMHMCGYKFGRWYSVVWMEKRLPRNTDTP